MSDSPQVFSRSISFEFNSAEARSALAKVGPNAKRYPILRTATVVDPLAAFDADPILAELAEWATTIVKLPNATNLERLKQEIEGFSSEFLLFVHAVREVKLRILGPEPFETSHISRDLGDGVLKIERPDGEGDEWFVQDRMHSPSAAAREQVGQAVSREKVKVTVALPARQSRQRIGQFWAYFPLQDQTSASALFNAPWSVNDDRTTLLQQRLQPRDPAHPRRRCSSTCSRAHGLPRIRRRTSTTCPPVGARTAQLRRRASDRPRPGASRRSGQLIPDAKGVLRHATDLRPLDFAVSFEPQRSIRAWIESPNTGDDVPSWRCYATPTRVTRLRRPVHGRASGRRGRW